MKRRASKGIRPRLGFSIHDPDPTRARARRKKRRRAKKRAADRKAQTKENK